jgi:hypothetical protein
VKDFTPTFPTFNEQPAFLQMAATIASGLAKDYDVDSELGRQWVTEVAIDVALRLVAQLVALRAAGPDNYTPLQST